MERKWLKDDRNIQGLTHQNIADACNITRSYYTQIESGIRNPSVAVAKKITKKLEFDWTLFFNEECNLKKQLINIDKAAGVPKTG